MKKTISAILTAALIMTSVSLGVSADETDETFPEDEQITEYEEEPEPAEQTYETEPVRYTELYETSQTTHSAVETEATESSHAIFES